MQTGTAQKLRINLARWKCFSFRVTTEVTLGEDITKLLGIDPKHRFARLHEEYTRSGIAHSMTLRFVRRIREQNRYAIRVVYDTEEPKEGLPRLMSGATSLKPSEGFLELCNLEASFVFRCDCSFSYRREDEDVHFPLPVQIEDELFDEIRGVRFVKLQQNKILWENFLDLVETDLMVHRIKFAHEGKFSVDLPQKLLKQAKAISQKT